MSGARRQIFIVFAGFLLVQKFGFDVATITLLWLVSPALVFLSGAAIAGVSLLLALNAPRQPQPGNEVLVGRRLRALRAPAL